MDIKRYELRLGQDGYTLFVYLDSQLEEFSSEFGRLKEGTSHLHTQIQRLINENFPHLKISAAKVMVGTVLISTIYLGATVTPGASAATTTNQLQQTSTYDFYFVRSGDSLSVIAKRFNVSVDSIKTVNGLTTNTIFVGQKLNLPFYTYTVRSGDSLSVIAKRFHTTSENLQSYNQLTSTTIFIGQKIKIPRTTAAPTVTAPPPPTSVVTNQTGTYTVVSGDSLSVIAKKLGTTVDTIRSLNGLTSNIIYIGQVLKVPATQTTSPTTQPPSEPVPKEPTVTQPAPGQTTTTYTVVSGDSLSVIAKRLGITVDQIKQQNNLTTDVIYIGQTLQIPQSGAVPSPTEPEVVEPITPNEPIDEGTQVEPVEQVDPAPVDDPTEPNATTTYTVVSGDSLSVIAKRFHMSVDMIKSANGLTSDTIFIGQNLTIPTGGVENPEVPEDGEVPETPEPADTVAPSTPVLVLPGNITSGNQASYTLSGTAEANSTIAIMVNDGSSPPLSIKVTADGEGKFTTNIDTSQLKDGNLSITTNATDAAGNQSAEGLFSVKKDTDTAAPTLSVSNDINHSTALAYPVTGTAEPGSRVTIAITDGVNPAVMNQSIANERGEFRTILDIHALNDGNMTITVTSVDASGNTSEEISTTATKDSVSTDPVIDNKMPVSIENANNYTIFGLAEPGATVELTVSDGTNPSVTATATANETGEFRANVNLLSLNDGTLTITSRAVDSFGNSSEAVTTITKETSIAAPVIESSDIVNSQTATGYTIFGIAQPGSTIDITVSDGFHPPIVALATTDSNGEFHATMDLSTLLDTALIVSVTQTTESGFKSKVGTTELTKDASAPGAPIFNNNHLINQSNQSAFVLTGKGEPNAEIRIHIFNANGGMVDEEDIMDAAKTAIPAEDVNGVTDTATPNNGQTTTPVEEEENATGPTDAKNIIETTIQADENGEYRIPVDLSSLQDGDVVFEISQVDDAGNISPLTTKTLQKDTFGPTNVTLDSLPTIFSGNVTDYTLSGMAEPQITLDMVLSDGTTDITKTITTDSSGFFTLPVDMSSLKDGDITVSFVAKDAAGNTSDIAPITLHKDTAAAEAVLTDLAPYVNSLNQNEFSINGTSVEDGADVNIVISDGSTAITKTTGVVDGRFTERFDLSSLADGRLTVDLAQTDRAGNTSTIQSTILEKDTIVDHPLVSKNGFEYGAEGSIFTIMGTTESNATVLVALLSETGEELTTFSSTADENGFYSIGVPLTGIDASAVASASVTQTDVAGNVSEVVSVDLHSHSVTAGESLYAIAKRYNTTVDALRSLNHLTSDVIQPNQTLRLPVMASEVVNLGYMYFNTSNYTDLVNQTAHSVNTLSPSYFDINVDGSLKINSTINRSYIDSMHQQGIRIVPFLSNHWNREAGRAMLANKEQAAQQIADAVALYNLDGVNVDIENVTNVDRDDYTEFVRLLREKIPATKEVSVAVAANPNGWTAGWHGSYDYTNLAKYADYLMIMSYDESYPGGVAGPVASAPWVERSIQYAIDQDVAPDKIVMGISHFGRYWIEGQSYGGFGISNWQVDELVKKYNGEVVWDEKSQTPKAVITIEAGDPKSVIGGTTLAPGTYTIWFDNNESIQEKLSLVEEYGLRGVGNWSIGQESETVWNNFATILPTTVPVTSPPPSVEVGGETSDPAVTTVSYKVVSGDSLWAIAQRFGTTVTAIKAENGLTSDNIYIGQTLRIPTVVENVADPVESVPMPDEGEDDTGAVPVEDETGTLSNDPSPSEDEVDPVTEPTPVEDVSAPMAEPTPDQDQEPTATTVTYRVTSGDSLSVIAKRYGTTVSAIKEANGLTTDNIYIGQSLRIPTTTKVEIPVPEPVVTNITYKVVSGDSLSVIAKRYNTTVTSIKEENGLTGDSIYIGQTLRIPT